MFCKHHYLLRRHATHSEVYCCKCGKHNKRLEKKIDKLLFNTRMRLKSIHILPEEYWADVEE